MQSRTFTVACLAWTWLLFALWGIVDAAPISSIAAGEPQPIALPAEYNVRGPFDTQAILFGELAGEDNGEGFYFSVRSIYQSARRVVYMNMRTGTAVRAFGNASAHSSCNGRRPDYTVHKPGDALQLVTPMGITSLGPGQVIAALGMPAAHLVWAGRRPPYDQFSHWETSRIVGTPCNFSQTSENGFAKQIRGGTQGGIQLRNAHLPTPRKLAYRSTTGDLFVSFRHTIAKIDGRSGIISHFYGNTTDRDPNAYVRSPLVTFANRTNVSSDDIQGIALFNDGHLLVGDGEHDAVRKVDLSTGEVTNVLWSRRGTYWPPVGRCLLTTVGCDATNTSIHGPGDIVPFGRDAFFVLSTLTPTVFFVNVTSSRAWLAAGVTPSAWVKADPSVQNYTMGFISSIAIANNSLILSADAGLFAAPIKVKANAVGLGAPAPLCDINRNCFGHASIVYGMPATGCDCACKRGWSGPQCNIRPVTFTATPSLTRSAVSTFTHSARLTASHLLTASHSLTSTLTEQPSKSISIATLPPPTAIPRPDLPMAAAVVEATQAAVTTAAGLAVVTSPGAVMQASRAMSVLALTVCNFQHDAPVAFPLSFWPGFQVGGTKYGSYYRGAVVANLATLGFVGAVCLLMVVFLRCARGDAAPLPTTDRVSGSAEDAPSNVNGPRLAWYRAARTMRFPGIYSVAGGMALDGLVANSVAVALHGGRPEIDYALCACTILLVLLYLVGVWYLAARFATRHCVYVPTTSDAALQLVDTETAEAVRAEKPGFAVRFVVGTNTWSATGETGVATIGAAGYFFNKYRGGAEWYYVIDALLTAAVAAAKGTMPNDKASCNFIIIIVLVVCVVAFVFGLWQRPYSAPIKNVLMAIGNGLTVAAATAALLGLMLPDRDATGAAQLLAVSAGYLTLIGIAVMLYTRARNRILLARYRASRRGLSVHGRFDFGPDEMRNLNPTDRLSVRDENEEQDMILSFAHPAPEPPAPRTAPIRVLHASPQVSSSSTSSASAPSSAPRATPPPPNVLVQTPPQAPSDGREYYDTTHRRFARSAEGQALFDEIDALLSNSFAAPPAARPGAPVQPARSHLSSGSGDSSRSGPPPAGATTAGGNGGSSGLRTSFAYPSHEGPPPLYLDPLLANSFSGPATSASFASPHGPHHHDDFDTDL
jgi:hypothetical protein